LPPDLEYHPCSKNRGTDFQLARTFYRKAMKKQTGTRDTPINEEVEAEIKV
jgi:hypothetical protein